MNTKQTMKQERHFSEQQLQLVDVWTRGKPHVLVKRPADTIFAQLLGQVRCVGRSTVLSEGVTISRTFSDPGQHFGVN